MGTVYPTTKSTATDLLSTLPQKFEAAKTSGELFFFPSTSRDIHSEGRRVCLLHHQMSIMGGLADKSST